MDRILKFCGLLKNTSQYFKVDCLFFELPFIFHAKELRRITAKRDNANQGIIIFESIL